MVTDGSQIQLTVDSLAVTPWDSIGILFLFNNCPCGVKWQIGVTYDVASCPAGTCNHWEFLRHPAGLKYYHTIQILV